jgi:NAD(P)-dependent dehydrogenase (short-subunit alcohol dehydrogenase family)
MSRTVLISGASKGIGRALAERMAEQGHKVVGIARTSDATPHPWGRGPVRGRAPAQARTIDAERLRELAAELGFWPDTTEEADIEQARAAHTRMPTTG